MFIMLLLRNFQQSKLIMKKSVSVISKIISVNADFRIFVNASHSIFLKKKTLKLE